jgi:hypothetical protein
MAVALVVLAVAETAQFKLVALNLELATQVAVAVAVK